jgi:hypothetical protein
MDGEEIPLLEWANMFGDINKRRIGETIIGKYKISTVLLGVDYSWGEGSPLIFETMVFPLDGNYVEDYCGRYTTKEKAAMGHYFIVIDYAIMQGLPIPSWLDLTGEKCRYNILGEEI